MMVELPFLIVARHLSLGVAVKSPVMDKGAGAHAGGMMKHGRVVCFGGPNAATGTVWLGVNFGESPRLDQSIPYVQPQDRR